MSKSERATLNLQHTGWNTMEAARKLTIHPRIVRMYLNGQREIPSRLWRLIPVAKQIYDTGQKARTIKEAKKNKINELKNRHSIKFPQYTFFDELIIIMTHRNRILSRWQMLINCITGWFATVRKQRFLP
jgi:hypothetical protein